MKPDAAPQLESLQDISHCIPAYKKHKIVAGNSLEEATDRSATLLRAYR